MKYKSIDELKKRNRIRIINSLFLIKKHKEPSSAEVQAILTDWLHPNDIHDLEKIIENLENEESPRIQDLHTDEDLHFLKIQSEILNESINMNDVDFIKMTYLKYLGRPVDSEGLEWQIQDLKSHKDRAATITGVGRSEEAKERFLMIQINSKLNNKSIGDLSNYANIIMRRICYPRNSL